MLYQEVASGLVVYPAVMARRVAEHLPFLVTENLMMEGVVKAAGDRQMLHEKIRRHAMETWHHMRVDGGQNDLLGRLRDDPAFDAMRAQIPDAPAPHAYTGRAVQQVDEFLEAVYQPHSRAAWRPCSELSSRHTYNQTALIRGAATTCWTSDSFVSSPTSCRPARARNVSTSTSANCWRVDEQRRSLLGRVEDLKAQRNKMSREIATLQGEPKQAAIAAMKEGGGGRARAWRGPLREAEGHIRSVDAAGAERARR